MNKLVLLSACVATFLFFSNCDPCDDCENCKINRVGVSVSPPAGASGGTFCATTIYISIYDHVTGNLFVDNQAAVVSLYGGTYVNTNRTYETCNETDRNALHSLASNATIRVSGFAIFKSTYTCENSENKCIKAVFRNDPLMNTFLFTDDCTPTLRIKPVAPDPLCNSPCPC